MHPFCFAIRHENNVKGLAFMEAILKRASWGQFLREFRTGFKMFRTPGLGWLLISAMNVIVKQLLPKAIVRGLSDQEKRYYEAPYLTIASRRPVRQWPREIPIDRHPSDVHTAVAA